MNGMQNNNKVADGFLTVEAAFILPFASILMLLLVYLCSYLYQNCFLNQAAYLAAFRGSRFAENAPADSYTVRQLEELLDLGLLSFGEEEREVNAGALQVKVGLKRATPFSRFESVVPELSVMHKSLVRRPVAYIRGLRWLQEAGGTEDGD